MANAEQLSILKQGVDTWNGWRTKNLYVYADLNEAQLSAVELAGVDLRIAHLRRANLFRANLSGADLSGADLSDADLREANLSQANLTRANLNGASLSGAFVRDADLQQANLLAANLRNANLRNAAIGDANLMVANLSGADLSGADLGRSNLTKAHLAGASLRRADLRGATFSRANLSRSDLVEALFIDTDLVGADVSEASAGLTVFANAELGKVKGLESVDHRGPSHISMDTLILSEGRIPEIFLRGCGLSDADVEYARLSRPDLGMEEIEKILHKIRDLRAAQTPQVSPLFISYSHADGKFVDRIGDCLKDKGIRFWRESHERKAGRLETHLDKAFRQNPKVLLILSDHSMKSDWVEQEIRTARELERESGGAVLCLVELDESRKADRWPKQIMEQITESDLLDFSAWRDKSKFESTFQKLIDSLDLFHRREAS